MKYLLTVSVLACLLMADTDVFEIDNTHMSEAHESHDNTSVCTVDKEDAKEIAYISSHLMELAKSKDASFFHDPCLIGCNAQICLVAASKYMDEYEKMLILEQKYTDENQTGKLDIDFAQKTLSYLGDVSIFLGEACSLGEQKACIGKEKIHGLLIGEMGRFNYKEKK